MEINNVAVVITGGASGMGAATAKRLSQLGARVSLLDTNYKKANEIAASLNAAAFECDVTQEDSVAHALEAAAKKNGPARICINCAGVLHSKRMVNQQGPMPLEEFSRVLTINVVGTFNVMRLAAAAMIPLDELNEDHERGLIINTASIAAEDGQIGQTAYSASKGSIVSLTLPAARELAQFGIRVMSIAPGLVDTPMFALLSDTARASLANSVPFPKRLAHPDEYAKLVEHIIYNTMINGTVIRLDGAIRMAPK